MRKTLLVFLFTTLAGCSSGDNGNSGPISCTNSGQKQFVAEVMWDWYLWTDLLPDRINGGDFATPEDLLAYFKSFSPRDGNGRPIDTFSYIGSAAEDEQFFGGVPDSQIELWVSASDSAGTFFTSDQQPLAFPVMDDTPRTS